MHGYSETILKYAGDDRHAGELVNPDGVGEVGLGAGEAGSKLAVRFMLKCQGKRVAAIRYQVFGCGYTIAACAAAAQLAEGRPLDCMSEVDAAAIEQHLGGLPKERYYCAELAAEALQSAVSSVRHRQTVVTAQPVKEHGPRISASHPVYRKLMNSPLPPDVHPEERHLFACLLAVSSDEPWSTEAALGLKAADLAAAILERFFPGTSWPPRQPTHTAAAPPAGNPEIRALLRRYADDSPDPQLATWFADIVVARAAHPGHLWAAMGLFERADLSSAISRLLPSLKRANNKGMRWKRFLFKQICDLNGNSLCKSPNCGDCSDYALCFAPE